MELKYKHINLQVSRRHRYISLLIGRFRVSLEFLGIVNHHGTEAKNEAWNKCTRRTCIRCMRLKYPQWGYRTNFYLPSGKWIELDTLWFQPEWNLRHLGRSGTD